MSCPSNRKKKRRKKKAGLEDFAYVCGVCRIVK